MRITAITAQQRQPNRVNVMVDGKYRFSLDIFQLSDLGVKVGKDYTEDELTVLEQESQFGKLYARALDYSMLRPHSAKEIRDYLWRKTRTTRVRSKKTGELYEKPGVSQVIAARVYERLVEKGYIDDEKFTRYWVENRSLAKGASQRKLSQELMAKGVERSIVEAALVATDRSEEDELKKVIAKKRNRYPDEQKFIAYLMRQGFHYDDIREAISNR